METAFVKSQGVEPPVELDGEYQDLIYNAEAAIDLFTLAERAEDDLLAELIPLDEYLAARKMDRSVILQYLNTAIQNLYYRMDNANSVDTVLTELKKSGAVVIDAGHVYLPPDDGRMMAATSDAPADYKIKTEPRLALAIAALRTLGIYGDDLIVRVGRVDKDMMREHPYIVLEIPRINKQIILCEQVGNRTFVAHEILDPQHFERLKKSLLRGLNCVTDFVGGNDWGKTLLAHLKGNAADFVVGPKVKNLAFKEAARKPKKIKLTQDIIVQAAKEWAAGHKGVFPIKNSPLIEDGILAGRTWLAVHLALIQVRVEGVPRKTTLAQFLEMKDFKVNRQSETRKLTQDIIVQAAKEWVAGHDGLFPTSDSRLIQTGILAGRTWLAVNSLLNKGYVEGLPKGKCKGLADFLDKKSLKISWQSETKKLTEKMILDGMIEWVREPDGKFPLVRSGMISKGTLAGEEWKNIHQALSRGMRGLAKGKYRGLGDFKEQYKKTVLVVVNFAHSLAPPAPPPAP